MHEVLAEKAGSDTAKRIYEKADIRLEEHYGKEMVELMHAGMVLDYWVTPSCRRTELLKAMWQE